MLLRDHPLMSHRGVRSWPPTLTWTDGLENKRPRGEIGILEEVLLSNIQPVHQCFLYIDYQGSSYVGCLMFHDHAFCRLIAELLQLCCNCPLAEIGGLDLQYTL